MVTLPILQQGRSGPMCPPNDELPDFYMEDYSILGLLVASLDRTHQVLTGRHFTVHIKSDHLKIEIDRADQMPEIITLLIQNGIECQIADIVDQVYQG